MRPYAGLSQPSTLADTLLDSVAKSTPSDWTPYYGWSHLPIPLELLLTDPLLKQIYDKHSFGGGILVLPQSQLYDWHTDINRGVSINMLLTPEIHSHCVLRYGTFIMDLPYKKDTYYLFNPQVEHMVMNFEKPRYMFSIEFHEDKTQLSYKQLHAELAHLLG